MTLTAYMDWQESNVDAKDLVKKVSRFLGIEFRLLGGIRKYIQVVDAATQELVTTFVEVPNVGLVHNVCLLETPVVEISVDSRLATKAIDDRKTFALACLELLGKVKMLGFGLDCMTFEPKKTLDNPFFGLKSPEELALKFDLISNGDRE